MTRFISNTEPIPLNDLDTIGPTTDGLIAKLNDLSRLREQTPTDRTARDGRSDTRGDRRETKSLSASERNDERAETSSGSRPRGVSPRSSRGASPRSTPRKGSRPTSSKTSRSPGNLRATGALQQDTLTTRPKSSKGRHSGFGNERGMSPRNKGSRPASQGSSLSSTGTKKAKKPSTSKRHQDWGGGSGSDFVLPPEIERWLYSLKLDKLVVQPKRDLSDGIVVAKILEAHFKDEVRSGKVPMLMNMETGQTLKARRSNWANILDATKRLGIGDVLSDYDVAAVSLGRGSAAVSLMTRLHERVKTLDDKSAHSMPGRIEVERKSESSLASERPTFSPSSSFNRSLGRSGSFPSEESDDPLFSINEDAPVHEPSRIAVISSPRPKLGGSTSPSSPSDQGALRNALRLQIKQRQGSPGLERARKRFQDRQITLEETDIDSRGGNWIGVSRSVSGDDVAGSSERLAIYKQLVVLIQEGFLNAEMDDVEQHLLLGRGRFSSVYAGLYKKQPNQHGAHSPQSNDLASSLNSTDSTAEGSGRTEKVAIKEFMYGPSDVPLALLRLFFQEIKILKRTEHPKVIKLIAVVSQPRPMLLLELMEVGSLRDTMTLGKEWAKITLAQKLRLTADIAEGLAYLHAVRVIHRDLKSHNIMLGSRLLHNGKETEGYTGCAWVAKIGDLGSAVALQPGSQIYEEVGTSGWTAPEVFSLNGYELQADVWSFGVLIWEILSDGSPNPFTGVPTEQYIERLEEGERWPIPTGTRDSIKSTVTTCWNMDPDKRPTMSTLQTAAAHILQQQLGEDGLHL